MSSTHQTHSHGHDDHGHHEHAHGNLKSYLIGFALAIILTVAAFGLAMGGYFTPATTAAFVLLLAVVQVVVHLIYFLHMDSKSENGWNMMALIFTIIILATVLAGSVWIMHHLDSNMMPMYMTPEAARNMP